MKRGFVLFLLVVSAAVWADTTVYKRVRPDGTVEFSDAPLPGGTAVQVPDVPTFSAPVPRPAPPQAAAPAQKPPVAYESIQVTQPTDNQTVFFDENGLPVTITVRPGLQAGHSVAVYLDGQMAAKGGQGSFMLKDVPRGSHTLAASILDASGNQVMSTSSITFQMIQHMKRP